MKRLPQLTMTLLFTCLLVSSCTAGISQSLVTSEIVEKPALKDIKSEDIRAVLTDSYKQIGTVTGYTQRYYSIPYPGGDVPANTGACTDVVIRAFRAADIDLQKEVHEDMASNFSSYPSKWGLKKTDSNIDHRRVPNLDRYFSRKGKALEISSSADDFKPGDVVAWDLNGRGMTHIGIVSNKWDKTTKRYLIVHNIGGGAQLEDRLFEWTIIGHYRYFD